MGRYILKVVGRGALLLFAGAVIGTLLLTLSYMLPVKPERQDAARELLEKEGWYPRASVTALSLDTHFHSFLPDVLDNFTDAIMLDTALGTAGTTPLEQAMNAHSEYAGDYAYYWHGYVFILRPLMLLMDFSEIRILNGIGQLLLLSALAYFIGKEKGLGHVLMLATSYLLISSLALPLSLQFTWVFYTAYAGTLVLLRKRAYFSAKSRYVYFFMAIGMLTSYLDLLTYPLFTWGVPLVWWLVTDRAKEREIFWLRRVVISGFAWIAGYALMWAAKWGIASVVLGRDIFESAIYEVFFCSGMSEGASYGLQARLNAAYINWKHYGYVPYALLLGGWLMWWIYRTIKGGWYAGVKRYAYFLTGISGPVWFFAVTNHTLGHHFFTYRVYGVSVLAFLALALESAAGWEGKQAPGLKRRTVMCCVVAAAAAAALPFMLLAREDVSVFNGGAAFTEVEMADNGSLEMSFTPGHDEIKRLHLGLSCEGGEGRYEITLWEGETPKYREALDIADCEGNYQGLDVSWKLHRGRTYRLTVDVAENSRPVYAWVTQDGETPLKECGNLILDKTAAQGQLLLGILYRCLPVSGETRLFLWMTWTGILLAGTCTLASRRLKSWGPEGEA